MPQGGVISPVLSNLFLHYVFDMWMANKHKNKKWCRYADDGIIHCKTESSAKNLLIELKQQTSLFRVFVNLSYSKILSKCFYICNDPQLFRLINGKSLYNLYQNKYSSDLLSDTLPGYNGIIVHHHDDDVRIIGDWIEAII